MRQSQLISRLFIEGTIIITTEVKGVKPGQSVSVPLVSVIIPAYNAEAFIEATLASVLAQTYTNIEVLAVDDGSRDRTAEIVQAFAEQDSRISLLRSSNQGVAAARNLAIENSSGEYIAPLDADDIWYPQNLEKQVDCFSLAGPDVGLVYAWSTRIDENGQLTGGYNASDVEGEACLSLVYSNFIGHASAPLIRRSCFEHVGGYDSKYREYDAEGSEDHDLYIRIAEHYRFGIVREFLIGYRQIKGSMSCNTVAMAKAHALLMTDVRGRHPELPERVYRWAKSASCEYLARKCNQCGDRWGTLRWLSKAVTLDPVLLLYRRLYVLVFKDLIKLTMRPVVVMVRKGLGLSPAAKGHPGTAGELSIADIERRRNAKQGAWDSLLKRRLRYLREIEVRDRAE